MNNYYSLFLFFACFAANNNCQELYGDNNLDGVEIFSNDKTRAEYWLPIAAYAGDIKQVQELLQYSPNLNKQHTWWREGPAFLALQAATAMGNTEIVNLLLKNGADPNKASEELLKFDKVEIFGLPKPPEWIYELNKLDPSGMSPTVITPLMYAAKGGYIDIVRLLLNAGADTSIKNFGDNSAADYAKTSAIQQLIIAADKKRILETSFEIPETQKCKISVKKSDTILLQEIKMLIDRLQQLVFALNQ